MGERRNVNKISLTEECLPEVSLMEVVKITSDLAPLLVTYVALPSAISSTKAKLEKLFPES